MNLSNTTCALSSTIKGIGGNDAALIACDRMYGQVFRSEPVVLSECPHSDIRLLQQELNLHVYVKETGIIVGECYYEKEEAQDAADLYMANNHKDLVVNENTLVVDLCNYKGEGEGDSCLYILNKHLPVFKSKDYSFNF